MVLGIRTRRLIFSGSVLKQNILRVSGSWNFQFRCASLLGSLITLPGSINKKIRRGRGPSSGKGKTSGRGHKGQKQHGKVPAGFTGGQTPLSITNPARGKNNKKIQDWIDQGRIDPSIPITLVQLYNSRCVHQVKDGIKLLARNSQALRTPINITVSRASASAIAAVERTGGSVVTRYYSGFAVKQILLRRMHPTISLRSHPLIQAIELNMDGLDVKAVDRKLDCLNGFSSTGIEDTLHERFSSGVSSSAVNPVPPLNVSDPLYQRLQEIRRRFPLRLPDPVRRRDLEYYRESANRGYLSHEVGVGENASLFYRPRGYIAPKEDDERKAEMDENRLF